MGEYETFGRMGIALAIAVLIGFERSWSERGLADGQRVAGVRTFGLIGLVGAATALLSQRLGGVVLAFGFLAVALVMLFGRYLMFKERKDIGATTVTAGLLTFALGAMAMTFDLGLTVAIGVVATVLLGIKAELHGAVRRIGHGELLAVFKLLLMILVLLPVLPNRGFGPWDALNPFEIWLMVVLICALSFVGYVGVRVFGRRKGVMLAALAGSLVSSTAVTISLSQLPDHDRSQTRLIGGAIILAWSVMYARTLVVVSIFGLSLLEGLSIPLGMAALTGLLAAGALLRPAEQAPAQHDFELRNPFDFWMAFKFAAVLALVMLLAKAMNATVGESGVLVAAGLSGLADVDAATLTVAHMTPGQISFFVGVGSVLLASMTNLLLKAGIAIYNSKRRLLPLVLLGVGSQTLAILVGALVALAFLSSGRCLTDLAPSASVAQRSGAGSDRWRTEPTTY